MSKPLILIVEPDIRESKRIATCLDESYDILMAHSASTALSLYENVFMKVRIVLLNINLESNTGFDVLESMREISVLPEIIVMSEGESIQDAIKAMKYGAYNFLTKPVSERQLKDIVDLTLDNVDNIKRIEDFSKQQLINQMDIDRRLALSQDHIAKKQLSGESINAEELMSYFPLATDRKDLSLDDLKSEIGKQISKAILDEDDSKVLIIEDEEIYRNMLKGILEKEFTVLVAEDGETALKIADDEPNIGIILLDIFLPDTSGAEILPELKQKQEDAEIIIVTAFELIDIAVKTLRDGAYDFLNKPVLKDDLMATVNKAAQKRQVKRILKSFGKEFVEEQLSQKTKLKILEELYNNRQRDGKSLYMEDIYTFFPELRDTFIPEHVVLPESVMKKGITQFVGELRTKVGQFGSPPPVERLTQ